MTTFRPQRVSHVEAVWDDTSSESGENFASKIFSEEIIQLKQKSPEVVETSWIRLMARVSRVRIFITYDYGDECDWNKKASPGSIHIIWVGNFAI